MKPESKSSWILRTWSEFKKALDAENESFQMIRSCKDIILKWQPPEHEFTTLNVDGSINASYGRARGGGVLRDETGGWKRGFLGRSHSLHALKPRRL